MKYNLVVVLTRKPQLWAPKHLLLSEPGIALGEHTVSVPNYGCRPSSSLY